MISVHHFDLCAGLCCPKGKVNNGRGCADECLTPKVNVGGLCCKKGLVNDGGMCKEKCPNSLKNFGGEPVLTF